MVPDSRTIVCSVCTVRFRTRLSLRLHKSQHPGGVGGDATATEPAVVLCEVALPVPFDEKVHVCRICCLAFQSKDSFSRHSKTHNAVISCLECSQTCIDDAQADKHKKSHRDGSILFGCSRCHTAYKDEFELHRHLASAHAIPLVHLCKLCNFGSTRRSTLVSHVEAEHRSTVMERCMELLDQMHATDSVIRARVIRGIVAICPRRKLHYQPADANSVSQGVGQQQAASADVGECAHRSFIVTDEPTVDCGDCGTFLAVNKYARAGGLPGEPPAPVKLKVCPVHEADEVGKEDVFDRCHPVRRVPNPAPVSGGGTGMARQSTGVLNRIPVRISPGKSGVGGDVSVHGCISNGRDRAIGGSPSGRTESSTRDKANGVITGGYGSSGTSKAATGAKRVVTDDFDVLGRIMGSQPLPSGGDVTPTGGSSQETSPPNHSDALKGSQRVANELTANTQSRSCVPTATPRTTDQLQHAKDIAGQSVATSMQGSSTESTSSGRGPSGSQLVSGHAVPTTTPSLIRPNPPVGTVPSATPSPSQYHSTTKSNSETAAAGPQQSNGSSTLTKPSPNNAAIVHAQPETDSSQPHQTSASATSVDATKIHPSVLWTTAGTVPRTAPAVSELPSGHSTHIVGGVGAETGRPTPEASATKELSSLPSATSDATPSASPWSSSNKGPLGGSGTNVTASSSQESGGGPSSSFPSSQESMTSSAAGTPSGGSNHNGHRPSSDAMGKDASQGSGVTESGSASQPGVSSSVPMAPKGAMSAGISNMKDDSQSSLATNSSMSSGIGTLSEASSTNVGTRNHGSDKADAPPRKDSSQASSVGTDSPSSSRPGSAAAANAPRVLACPHCPGIRFDKSHALKLHALRHNPDARLFCLVCATALPSDEAMTAHMAASHGALRTYDLACPSPGCALRFETIQAFMAHSHGLENESRCSKCSLNFYSSDALSLHNREHTQGSLSCIFCGYCCHDASALQQHEVTHGILRWHMCTQCDLIFKSRDKLVEHFRKSHIEAMSNKCLACHSGFENEALVLDHMFSGHSVITVKPKKFVLSKAHAKLVGTGPSQ